MNVKNAARAYRAASVFDGESTRRDVAVLVDGGRVTGIADRRDIPTDMTVSDLGGFHLAPGFVDLQVNGGGGVLFNDAPSPEAIAAICRAHARFGVTSVVVTLITASEDVTRAAISAAIDAAGTPGFAGLHLEGPHISVAKRGAHAAGFVRAMDAKARGELIRAARQLPCLISTVAPEAVGPDDVRALAEAGIIVSLGHTAADHRTFRKAVDAGARLATHLFCAMSGLHHRDLGAVGAILDDGRVTASLIPDGVHVAPEAVRLALRAKAGPGRVFAVSDAMHTVGTDLAGFELDGRTVTRRDGALRLDDGTLAGADIDIGAAVRFLAGQADIGRDEALRMATLYPAQAIGRDGEVGRIAPGTRADLVLLDDALHVQRVWIGGEEVGADD